MSEVFGVVMMIEVSSDQVRVYIVPLKQLKIVPGERGERYFRKVGKSLRENCFDDCQTR